MFPLGTVLFPHETLDLRIFEPRYLALLADCLEADGRFGTVLIARGSEVGGGDLRHDAGTAVRIVAAGQLPGDRIGIRVVGESPLRVLRWLPDDPYPRAEVQTGPTGPTGPTASTGSPQVGDDGDESGAGEGGPDEASLVRAATSVRRARWLLSELGAVPARPDPLEGSKGGATDRRAGTGDPDEPDGPDGPDGGREVMAWRVCAAAPVGSFDRQAILAAPSWGARLRTVVSLCDAVAADATALLRAPGPDAET